MINRLKSKLSKDAHLKDLVKGSAITFILKIGGMLLGYFVIYLISKKNGADGAGYYSLINQFLLLIGVIATLGTNISVLRFIGQYNNDENRHQIKGLFKNLISLVLPFSILLGGLTVFFSDQIAQYLFKNSDYSNAVLYAGVILPFFAMNNLNVEFIRGLKRLKISESIRSITRPLIMIICLCIFWSTEIPNIYIVYFFGIGVLLNSLLSLTTVLHHLMRINSKKDNQISKRQILGVSLPMMTTTISSTLMTGIAFFLIEYYGSTEKVGVFSVALRISQVISVILVVVNTIAAPKFSDLYWAGKMTELQKLLHQSSKILFWTAFALSVIVISSSSWILGIFGQEFTEGKWSLIILTFGQLFNAATGSVGLFLNMSGNQKVLRNTSIIALAIQTVLAIILLPIWGILGASIAVTLAGVLWNTMCILYVNKKLKLKTYYYPQINTLRN